MTAQKLMEMALEKLDRPTDSDTLALYKERLLGYLNEALVDLTGSIRPWREDAVTVTGGQADLSTLPRTCVKVLAARVDGARRLFYYGASREALVFPGMGDGTAVLTYRYQPAPLKLLTDEPELGEEAQELMAAYAAARERSRFDAASQNAARIELTLYRQLAGKLGRNSPGPGFSQIYHIY